MNWMKGLVMRPSPKDVVLGLTILAFVTAAQAQTPPRAEAAGKPPTDRANSFYTSSREPLRATPFVKLPVTSFKPGGWLQKSLQLQSDGLPRPTTRG
jgi:hypothetical protein